MISVFLRRMIWLSSLTLLLWVGMNALPPPICAAAPTVQHSTYPLEKMPLLRLVLRLLQRFYIDPTQFKAAKMHKAGLQALERRLPEARVTWQTRQKKYTLQLGPHRKSFPSRRFIGLFDVWLRLQPVARFVKQHYKGEAPLSEIEYAMVIGVMSTLDKQTRVMSRRILLRRRALRPRRKGGKIGVVLRWDKKNKYLQIQRIQPDGPADLAGLKARDRIVAIDGRKLGVGSFQDWIGKIVGLRGSRVALHILRKGWPKPKRIVLIRARISQPLVTGHLLPGKIGYIRLRQFSSGASLLIREQLARLRRRAKGNLLGLALDLRNNPGGRVTEAVAIASMFVEQGQVVTYAGANIKRRTYNVSGKNVEALYPLVVMLSDHSASASELLAGALQGHQRALVIGQRSYGKGTVQSVSGIPKLGLMYRVTVAQYMVPPERSIQMVGVAPDIALVPVSVQPDKVRFYSTTLRDRAARKKRWPQFLQQYLDPSAKSLMSIRYLSHLSRRSKKSRPRAKKSRRRSTRSWLIQRKHPLGHDFEVWVARYMLANAKSGRRDLFYTQVKRALKKLQRQQNKQIVKALRAFNTNWSLPKKLQKKAKLTVKIQAVGVQSPIPTGKSFLLQVKIKNEGKGTAYRARTILRSKLSFLRYRELLFGQIKPGQAIARSLKVKLPHRLPSGVEPLTFLLQADGAEPAKPTVFPLTWKSSPQPRYTIAYQIADPSPDGNGDGRIQAGERVHLFVTIKQHGKAVATNPNLTLFVERVRVLQRRASLPSLASGKTRTAVFSLRVSDSVRKGSIYSTLTLSERKFGVLIRHRLPLSIAPPFPSLRPQTQKWGDCGPSTIYNDAGLNAHPIGTFERGATIRWIRTYRNAIQIALPAPSVDPSSLPNKALQRAVPRYLSAWVPKKACKAILQGPSQLSSLKWIYHFVPPLLSFANDSLQTQTAQTKISLTLKSLHGLRDLYLLQNGHKVHYQTVQYQNPRGLKQLTTSIAVKLKPGLNQLHLIARTLQGSFRYPFYRTYRK